MTFNGGHPIGDFPLVNQQLLPLMIYETGLTEGTVDANGIFQPIHYYPDPGSGTGGICVIRGPFSGTRTARFDIDAANQRILGAYSRGLCSEPILRPRRRASSIGYRPWNRFSMSDKPDAFAVNRGHSLRSKRHRGACGSIIRINRRA